MSRAQRGFTLIEVLLATALLVGGLALAFATVRSALAISQRGEQMAAHNERMRAVEGFLRRRLSMAMLTATTPPDPTREPVYFLGEPQHMLFVSDLPGYLGRGGPYVHELQVRGSGDAQRLDLALTLVQNGERIEETPPRPPEALADALRAVTFRYRGIDPRNGQLGEWQDRWEDTRRLPSLVSISVTPRQGPAWPPMVVALAQQSRGARP
ncbi:MAG: type II secretion system protein J [Stenotrophomonas rhizophila]|jgi:general secretion pathway protein J|uniref:type II secretion system protein J n=1 Tax=Stenotrophomonas rhizophila TaxID=216778 RepID=UPI0010C1346F|nr:type II secretion system protein J [Stenotrophomonas rhizophila]MDY0955951.1 type II secretion system protein J [Stenotrophomonas rhizophila]TKK05807.1 general secretion pathway protein GspJ [Stenotrophomonas rhizophila]